MRFGSIIVASLAAVASAMPAKEVSSNIDTVTDKSRELQFIAESLIVVDRPLLAAGEGNFPPIMKGLHEIISSFSVYNDELSQSPEKYSGSGADHIYDPFRNFVLAHQKPLSTLIDKADLLNSAPFIGEPMASLLGALGGTFDNFAYELIGMMQTHAAELNKFAESLDNIFSTAIDSYNSLQY